MILVDSSVWVDHLRNNNPGLGRLLDENRVLSHPFVIGEIALGNLRQREMVLSALGGLPQAIVADDREVQIFIEDQRLYGRGIGYVDVHLLTATRLTPDASLWTMDKRLGAIARGLGRCFPGI